MNQLHDIPGDHQLTVAVAGQGTAGTTDEFSLGPVPFKATVTEAYFVPTANITGHTTNYMTLQLTNRGQAGAGTTAVASLAFTNGVTGTAHDAKALTVDTAADDVAAGDVLTLDKAVAGTGLAMPDGVAVVVLRAR